MAGMRLHGVGQLGHIALIGIPTLVGVLVFVANLLWDVNDTLVWAAVVVLSVAQLVLPLAPIVQAYKREARQAAAALVPGSQPGRLMHCNEIVPGDFGVLPSHADVEYVERDNHAEMIRALDDSARLLLVGPAMVGKSRAALEIVRQRFPEYGLWRPNSVDDVRRMLSSEMLPKRAVVFLDDLERFAGGLSPQHLSQIASDDRIVVATMRTSELHLMSSNNRNKPLGWELPDWFKTPIWLGEWSPNELDRVKEAGGEDLRKAAKEVGLGSYLGGGPAVLRRLEIARSEVPDAYLLARLGSDWRTVGLESISDHRIQALLPAYADDNRDAADCGDAIEWITEQVNQHVAIAKRVDGGLRVSDFVVDHFQQALTPPPEALWAEAIDAADDEQLIHVGAHASANYGRADIAEQAWTASNSPYAAAVRAEARMEMGPDYWDEAEEMLRTALTAHDPPSPFVQVALGVLCEKRAGGPSAYSPEAEELFVSAADAGDSKGALNAAAAIERSGRSGEDDRIVHYLQKAMSLGHPWASGRLGLHYKEKGDLNAAEELLASAQDSAAQPGPHAQMDVRIAYGDLLDKTGRSTEAANVFRDAATEGPDQAAGKLALAVHLANRHTKSSTAEALEIVRELVRSSYIKAYPFCGTLLNSVGHRNESVSVLLDSVELGDGEAMFYLGEIYVAEGLRGPDADLVESGRLLLQAAAELGQERSHVPLGELCRVVYDDPEGALEWYRRAAKTGDHQAEVICANLLLKRGSDDDRTEARAILECLGQGDSPHQHLADNSLGIMALDDGDTAVAEIYFRRAARAGRGAAMRNLADLLADSPTAFKRLAALIWRVRGAFAVRNQPQTLFEISPQFDAGTPHDAKQSVRMNFITGEGTSVFWVSQDLIDVDDGDDTPDGTT